MKNKTGKVIISAILLLLFMLASRQNVSAQTPIPPTREALTKEIQARAQKDVGLGAAPLTPSDLAILFSDQAIAVGMTMSEAKNIYDDAYKAATPAKSPWDDLLKPQGGWIFLIVGALLVILGNIAKDYLTAFGKKLAEHAYQRLARFRPFWMIALRKYRQSLENTHRELKIPFRAGRSLEMKDVYVPVRVDGGDKKQVDAYQTIQNQKRLVVLGDPGSGKTMFLRHVVFTYARQGLDDFDGQPIPVYLELNRVENAGGDLLTALTKTLENHNFPGAEGFLKSALENHALLILLDGLDEVNAAARPALVDQIRDFDQKHPANRILVTCRKAVYQGELDAWVDGKLEIIEFSDQQIQRFMNSWQKDMPAEKSIEHFFRTLQERPQIMTLARNPLLLTMVAYLYTDTEFALPHSRSEFYSRSTDLLLDQWKLERNRYKATHKRIVLQRLALFNQSQAGKTGERRTLELADVLKEIRAVLPDLTLKTEDAQPLLDEIVQRSGLMLAIDGGTRYQFTHLTLQEYFAARALQDDQKGLLDFYRATPDAWREVVRLWCALEHDSTAMLKELYALDPVMAFECLSDAQQVDNAYADELIESFKPRFMNEALTDFPLMSAFGLLAADPRPRGKKWFEFVKDKLNDENYRLMSCIVLAQSNIPQAAEPLAKLATTESSVTSFLVQLGNLAVPALTKPAQRCETWAMDALVDIGTPQAAIALHPLLWEDGSRAYHVAWRLAALLPLSGVEEELRRVTITFKQRKTKQLDWIWTPFAESQDSALPLIAGRIAYLLHNAPKETVPSALLPIDPRLAIPLCVVAAQDSQLVKIETDSERKKLLKEINPPDLIENNIDRVSTHPIWRYIFSSLSNITQIDLLLRLVRNAPAPNIDDWRNLFRPLRYSFENSLQLIGVRILLIWLVVLNLFGVYKRSQLWSWENGLLFLAGTFIIFSVWRGKPKLFEFDFVLRSLASGFGPALGISVWFITNNWHLGRVVLIISTIGAVIFISICNRISAYDTVGVNKTGIRLSNISIFRINFSGISKFSITLICTITLIDSIINIISKMGNNIINPIISIGTLAILMFFFVVGGGSMLMESIGKALEFDWFDFEKLGGRVNTVAQVNSFSSDLADANRLLKKTFFGSYLLFNVLGGLSLSIFNSLFMYLPTKIVYNSWGLTVMLWCWAIYLASFAFLLWSSKRQLRRAENPLCKFAEYLPNSQNQP